MLFNIPDYFLLLCKDGGSKSKKKLNDEELEKIVDKLECLFTKYYLESITLYRCIEKYYTEEDILDLEYKHNKKATSLKIFIKVKNNSLEKIVKNLKKNIPKDYKVKISLNDNIIEIVIKRE